MPGEENKGANKENGGEGGKDNQQQQNNGVSAEQFNELSNIVKELATTTQTSIQSLAQTVQAAGKKPDDDDDDADDRQRQQQQPNARDLESMTRAEFASHLMQQIGGVIDKKVKAVDKKLEEQQSASTQNNLKQELAKAQEKYTDFDEWKVEMRDLAKENPYLSFERLYKLARTEHPDKAKQLDEKYNKPSGKDDGKGGDDKQKGGNKGRQPFGGNKPGTGSEEEETRTMSKKDAAEKAYEETVAALDFVDHSQFGNNV